MTFNFDKATPSGGAVHVAQRVLRVMTIVVAIGGIGFFVWRWLNPPKPRALPVAPASSADNETVYSVDLHNFPLTVGADNSPLKAVIPVEDNAALALEAVKDGPDIEPEALYSFLREVDQRYPADNFFMKRVPLVNLGQLREKPQEFRGKPVAVRGRIARVERSTLPENPSNVRFMLEGEILVPEQGLCKFITSRVGAVPVGAMVEFRGLFMKLVPRQAEGGKTEQVPLIVASHPVYVAGTPAPPASSSVGGPGVLVGILVVLFAVYMIVQFAMRRKGGNTNRVIEARRKAREMLGRTGHGDDLQPPLGGEGGTQA